MSIKISINFNFSKNKYVKVIGRAADLEVIQWKKWQGGSSSQSKEFYTLIPTEGSPVW